MGVAQLPGGDVVFGGEHAGGAPAAAVARERRRARTRLLASAVAVGVAAAVVGAATGLPTAVAAALAALLGGVVIPWRVRRRLVGRMRRFYGPLVDAGAAPPAAAVAVTHPLPERWFAALTAASWDDARALLADGFRGGGMGVAVDARRCIGAYRAVAGACASCSYEVAAVRGDEAAPRVLWVGVTQNAVERGGRALRMTWWERWELAHDGERLLTSELVGVTSLD